MENYYEYTLSKVRARMKPDIVPHIFTCQPDKTVGIPRLSSEKRLRKRKISEILHESDIFMPKQPQSINTEDTQAQPNTSNAQAQLDSTSYDSNFVTVKRTSDFACQVKLIKYRSKSIQVSLQENVKVEHIATSPIKFAAPTTKPKDMQKRLRFDSDRGNSSSEQITSDCTDATFSGSASVYTYEGASDSSEKQSAQQDKKLRFRDMFIDIIEKKLRFYTGIPKENHHFIALLAKRCSLRKHSIYLTLYKIKTNDSFEKIGDLFGMSKTYASQVFQRSIIVLSHFMEKLIVWPNELSIKKNLPIQFRITFSNVQSIIDCLEIEIQRPSSAKQQSLTWSDYKKCNTVKYLISSTPDGLINFVSKGYGGRTSDVALFEDCGFLSKLPENSVIMADRGFKKIETFLHRKNCTLVRPPSVVNKEKMSKDDVLLTKRIASVRIHIERVIKRVRDFKMLSPHATLHLNLVEKLDNIMIIACAIINLQQPIIKQM